VAGRGHAPPEGGCGRWPAGALPRWLPFLVKQVLKQATTCFRTALATAMGLGQKKGRRWGSNPHGYEQGVGPAHQNRKARAIKVNLC
jgi:hypothetical protein